MPGPSRYITDPTTPLFLLFSRMPRAHSFPISHQHVNACFYQHAHACFVCFGVQGLGCGRCR